MRAEARAKVNLALAVDPPRPDGLHPLRSLMLSVSLADELGLAAAEEDRFEVRGPGPDGRDNLAWRAVEAVREEAGRDDPVHVVLRKRIPVAAGLGGGSADAAAALTLAAAHFGVASARTAALAPGLGSDVPFCLVGGLAVVSGAGEVVEPLRPAGGFALAIVVPPVELETPAVYAAWDRLDGPEGPAVAARHLPPALRDYAPLANDLWPAARSLAPALDDWRAELAARWSRPVMMSGSGAALFAYFVDADEAASAGDETPPGARAVEAVTPAPRGVETGGGTLA